jgi:1,4-dihydroxy-2-naphthoate octaprenyltransferase
MTAEYVKPGLVSHIHTFLLLSRLPFHSVGILPFILGTVLAMHDGYFIRGDILFLGILGTVFIMLATYLAGEYYDQHEDADAGSGHKSRFSGGSQAIQQGLVDPSRVRQASLVALLCAGCTGLYVWLGLGTGPLTIPLGVLGMAGGFLYSARPVRWVSRGLGEIWIAICYGWLPVAAAYYLQAGTIPILLTLISLPICCSIVAVILINEFADFEADRRWGKRNLLVRTGLNLGIKVYGVLVCAAVTGALILAGWQLGSILIQVPALLTGLVLCWMVARGDWRDHDRREWICGGTLLVNLFITGSWIVAFSW